MTSPLIDIDVEKVADILRHVAATEVMPRFNNLATGEVREKNPGDFVTIADEASEKALAKALTDYLPGSIVVGEEAVSVNPAVLERFSESSPVWVIDPIDGTYNFAHGRSKFGILLALVQNGVTQYGWVYDAPGDRMGIAIKGGGATINGKPAQVRTAAARPADMVGMGGGGQAWHFEPVNGMVGEIINVRSSLHDFLEMAAGNADFVVHINKVTPWDHAATILLVQEAGGYVALAETGEPFKPSMHQYCMLIAAADKARWDMLHDVLFERIRRKRA